MWRRLQKLTYGWEVAEVATLREPEIWRFLLHFYLLVRRYRRQLIECGLLQSRYFIHLHSSLPRVKGFEPAGLIFQQARLAATPPLIVDPVHQGGSR